MANEIFTRIQLKHDSYANWNAVKDTFKPLPGEICIAEIPTGNAAATTAPTVLFKVGAYKKDASGNNTTELHTFAELPWASAFAADVYAWAKKPEAEFIAWAKGLVPVEVIDSETGKFVTNVTATNDEKGHHITITRSDVDWNDVKNAPDFALAADLGDVSKLNTTAKTAVGAINEHGAEIGDLASLNTTNKGNLVAAINEALQAVETGGTGSVVTITKETTPTAGSHATYVLKQGGKAVGDKIEIPECQNSAHSHTVGSGLKLTGAGGVSGETKHELNLTFVDDATNKKLKLVDATDNTKIIAEFDTTNFVKDGMLQSVVADQANNKLTFTWNTDGATTETVVELDKIADIYTAGTGATEVQVTISNANVITATLVEKGVDKSKLAEGVQASLDKANTAIQDSDLAAIAKTGNVNDLVQTEGDILVFNCGSATTVI